MSLTSRALFYASEGQAEIRTVNVAMPAGREHDICRVRSLWSGISRGTERLVFGGKLPESEWQRMRAPYQEGAFPFPVKYGYCNVGVIEAGPDDLAGCAVFSLFPHQEHFFLPGEAVVALPANVPSRRAILAANMETALNVLWDSEAQAGDRITIVGGGVLGLLVTYLAAQLPGADVTLIDTEVERGPIALTFGARFAVPEDAAVDPEACEADVVINASASAAGLRLGMELAGFEARIVEASWHGRERVGLDLGAAFHSRRLQLVSSQVGTLPADRRARWTHRRRIEKAISLLGDDRLDQLITGEVAFAALPDAIPDILRPGARGLMTAIRYCND